MDRFTHLVTEHAKVIVIITFILAALCGFLATLVPVNYDLASYLPKESPSTVAINVMEDEFDSSVPNARVMVDDVSLDEALEYKRLIADVEGVSSVVWLDDVTDITIPLGAQDAALVDEYFKDGHAIYSVTIEGDHVADATRAIYDIIGNGHAIGEAITTADTQNMAVSEVLNAFAILIPLIILLLVLSTSSWLEPLFFLLAIGVSIVFNMGTNVVFGELSNIAFTIAPILQLAVSLDYAIFLLHAFQRAREETPDLHAAMRKAMRESFSAIAASAATTIFGFAALGFMKFSIGAELGITLVKGIVFSFLCVMIFLPAFTILAHNLIDKTHHRALMPSFSSVGKFLSPIRIPAIAIVAVLVIPCMLAQQHMAFTYSMGSSDDMTNRTVADEAAIEEVYAQQTPLVLMVPKGDMGREVQLSATIEENPFVDSVLSYPTSVGAEIPVEFVDKGVQDEFYSENYARIVIYANTANEGTEAFGLVDYIHEQASRFYGDEALLAGEPASLYDMREVTLEDSRVTNTVAVLAILAVLFLTFRSLILPFVLIATIESAIIINLSIPYFTGDSLNYLGFLVINTVQLGATVDYAILFTDTYLKKRRLIPCKQALAQTAGETFKSILVSASILALAGFVLWITSSNGIISILGHLLFRGTLLSFLLVVTFLPGVLRLLDKPIGKTTWHSRFYSIHEKSKP